MDKIEELVERTRLTPMEIYQASLLTEADCLEIERLQKSYGEDIFYGENDKERYRNAVDAVVGQKIAKAQQDKILKDPDLCLIDRDKEEPIDETLIGVLESLCGKLDMEKDLEYLKAIGYALKALRANNPPVIPLSDKLKEVKDGNNNQ
ncbi:hypothetical protein LCGC14_2131010 [marine sediment metagenome]|uniref:Uncharacterized protein n=1 Tax=marine sediment metagenome TaxID=412755 RepID=A0A0F9GXJ1_9ZZZZ